MMDEMRGSDAGTVMSESEDSNVPRFGGLDYKYTFICCANAR